MTTVLAARCAADGEFCLAARHWTGGFRLDVAGNRADVRVVDGVPMDGDPGHGKGVVVLSGPADVWAKLLSDVPPPFATDVAAAFAVGLRRDGDPLAYWQYYPAIQRAVELLRPSYCQTLPVEQHRRFDSPVGRYVHVQLDGQDHRIYFEEAGSGIPLLAQHTAGSDGVQWRHLFECSEITDHFQLIAYDLPFHGKSLPPVGAQWWQVPYRLTAERARALPIALADALGLDRPVFMGCSVGGLLALDLAAHHPGRFRAVLALEAALKIEGSMKGLSGLWHPQVTNEAKARMMEGLMAPTAPASYRKETSYAYAAGWPQSFAGDLHYYFEEFDLRGVRIDTSQTAVHILTGEYDHSAPVEAGRAAHEAIVGSTFTVMNGLGHFPMSEDPERFLAYLLPVLRTVRE